MRNIVFHILIIVFFCISCNNFKAERIDFSKKTTAQILKHFIYSNDSLEMNSLIEMLQDSIKKFPFSQFITKDYYESEQDKFKVQFYSYDSRFDDVLIKERNVYVVVIYNPNQQKFEGKYIKDYTQTASEIKEFILNLENKDHLPQKKESKIKFLGLVDVSKQSFIIYPELSDSLTYRSNWFKTREIVLYFNSIYTEIRNEIALKKFNKPFKKLNIEQKESIIEFVSSRIVIIPNWEEKYIKEPKEILKMAVNNI